MTPPTVPVGEPSAFQAGDSVVFDTLAIQSPIYGSFTSDAYTLTYDWVSPAVRVTTTGAAQGSGWRTTLTTTQTDSLKTPGSTATEIVQWSCSVSAGGQKFTVASGRVSLTPNLTITGCIKSNAEQMLDLIEAALVGRIPQGMESYQVQGRAVSKIPIMDLYKLRNYYRAEVRTAKWGGAGTLQVTFNPPGPMPVPFWNRIP